MAFCINCGQELADGAKFCANCGKAVNDNSSTNQRKTVYEGEIHKCPNCGEVLTSFSSNCPSCGYEIRGIASSISIKNFISKMESAATNKEKLDVIRNFIIPNTKEDILEFLIIVATNVERETERNVIDAWVAKIEQAYKKAQLILADGKEFDYIQKIYDETNEKIKKHRKNITIKKAGRTLSELVIILPNMIFIIGWLLSVAVLIPLCTGKVSVGYQLLAMVDFILGSIFIPYAFSKKSFLPELVTSMGMLLNITILILMCKYGLCDVGTGLVLTTAIICSLIIFGRMFSAKNRKKNERASLNVISFIIAVVLMLVLLIVCVKGLGELKNNSNISDERKMSTISSKSNDNIESIVWNELAMGDKLPDYGKTKAEIIWDNENNLILYFYDTTKEEFEDYIKSCKDFGYTIDMEDNDGANFIAYNKEGYYLHLQWLDWDENKKLTIKLEDPKEMNAIIWPNSKMMKDVPVPNHLIGEVSLEYEDSYAVYIVGVEYEYFTKYVSLSMDKGFDIDYYKSKTYFSGENKNGTSITVQYVGFNTMYISVDGE